MSFRRNRSGANSESVNVGSERTESTKIGSTKIGSTKVTETKTVQVTTYLPPDLQRSYSFNPGTNPEVVGNTSLGGKSTEIKMLTRHNSFTQPTQKSIGSNRYNSLPKN